MSQPGDQRTTRASVRSRHLQDPEELRRNYERVLARERDRAAGTYADDAAAPSRRGMSLSQVQKWVMSVLAVTTILHLAGGIAIAGIFAERIDARVGLNIIAAVIGVLAVVVGRLIHGKSPLTWWLVIGVLPGVVGAWFTFR